MFEVQNSTTFFVYLLSLSLLLSFTLSAIIPSPLLRTGITESVTKRGLAFIIPVEWYGQLCERGARLAYMIHHLRQPALGLQFDIPYFPCLVLFI